MVRAWALCAAIGVMVATGCTASPTAPSVAAPFAEHPDLRIRLTRAEQQWAAAGIARYDFAVGLYCFCFHLPRPLRFQVRDGVSVSPGLDPAGRASVSNLESVDAIFAMIRRYVDRQPAYLDAQFHPTLGYPQSMFVDGDWLVADDELGVSVVEFTIQP